MEGIQLRHNPGFTVGVQWHAECEPENRALSRLLFEALGAAARRRVSDRPRPFERIAG